MTIQITTFSCPQPNYPDQRVGDFALAFEAAPRRCLAFSNILVDAAWATWMPHADYSANEANAMEQLQGNDSPYPDSALIYFPETHSEQAKKGLEKLMATWAQGESKVLGYSVEEAITLAYRDQGPEGLFVFLLCSYMEPTSIDEALRSVGLDGYIIVPIEEERSGSDFLSSMRENDVWWFIRLGQTGCIDDDCVLFYASGDEDYEDDEE